MVMNTRWKIGLRKLTEMVEEELKRAKLARNFRKGSKAGDGPSDVAELEDARFVLSEIAKEKAS